MLATLRLRTIETAFEYKSSLCSFVVGEIGTRNAGKKAFEVFIGFLTRTFPQDIYRETFPLFHANYTFLRWPMYFQFDVLPKGNSKAALPNWQMLTNLFRIILTTFLAFSWPLLFFQNYKLLWFYTIIITSNCWQKGLLRRM